MMSFDPYPNLMLPAISDTSYYLFFFLSFATLQLIVFTPIPVAIVFDAFRVKLLYITAKYRHTGVKWCCMIEYDRERHF